MKMKKILATLLATAVATTMAATSLFAATTIDIDAEYPGDWQMGTKIALADLQAIGGNVKVTLDVEAAGLLPQQYLLRPTAVEEAWVNVIDKADNAITSDTACMKADGFIPVKEAATTVEFVISADAIAATTGDIGFQVCSVWIKSATLEKVDELQAPITIIEDAIVSDPEGYCFGDFDPVAAPAAAEEAPAATENTETGNAPIVGMVAVMALAGVAMVASKKK